MNKQKIVTELVTSIDIQESTNPFVRRHLTGLLKALVAAGIIAQVGKLDHLTIQMQVPVVGGDAVEQEQAN